MYQDHEYIMRPVHIVHWIPWSTAFLTEIEGERFRRLISLVPLCVHDWSTVKSGLTGFCRDRYI